MVNSNAGLIISAEFLRNKTIGYHAAGKQCSCLTFSIWKIGMIKDKKKNTRLIRHLDRMTATEHLVAIGYPMSHYLPFVTFSYWDMQLFFCTQFPRRNLSLSWMSILKSMLKCSIPVVLDIAFYFPQHFHFSTYFWFVFSFFWR